MSHAEKCPVCGGSGLKPINIDMEYIPVCKACKGTGRVKFAIRFGPQRFNEKHASRDISILGGDPSL